MTNHTPNKENNAYKWANNKMPNKIASTNVVYGTIKPIKRRVLISDMHFGESKTKAGLIIMDDDGKAVGVHPRWGKVFAVGNLQEDVRIGQWILIAHGRWTRGVSLDQGDGEILDLRMVDEKDILMVSDEEPNATYQKPAGYFNSVATNNAKS